MKEPAFIKGMKDLRLTIAYRNNIEMDDYVAQNYEAFSKLLKEIGLIK
jgi:tripartite-type tricarboxylate transporter receptor subunit TctC